MRSLGAITSPELIRSTPPLFYVNDQRNENNIDRRQDTYRHIAKLSRCTLKHLVKATRNIFHSESLHFTQGLNVLFVPPYLSKGIIKLSLADLQELQEIRDNNMYFSIANNTLILFQVSQIFGFKKSQ